jgi:hypothetical protein
MPLWKRTYRCPKCGLVIDRDDNSAYNIRDRYFIGLVTILTWYLARLVGPHTERISVRCADVFTAIEDGVSVRGH